VLRNFKVQVEHGSDLMKGHYIAETFSVTVAEDYLVVNPEGCNRAIAAYCTDSRFSMARAIRCKAGQEPMVSLVGVGSIAMRPRYRSAGVWF
jgi:hypothetical protein